MKNFFTAFTLLIAISTMAQSPYLSILVMMDSAKADLTRYKIEMKICEPGKMTERGSWFTHDTSKINFASLEAADINCGEYFEKGMPTLISGREEKKFNQFEFSNQVFAWEKIFIFKISNWSSRGWHPEMYIVMPVKYKSFRTHIVINDIEFQSGKAVFLINANAFYDESELIMNQSLKNEKGVDLKGFSLEKNSKKIMLSK